MPKNNKVCYTIFKLNEIKKLNNDIHIQMIPDNYSKVDETAAVKMERLLDMFEDNDDVQNVWHNAEGLE